MRNSPLSDIQPCTGQGFLLTRTSRDTARGIEITLWLKTFTGPVKLIIQDELSVFFVSNEQADLALNVVEAQKITLAKTKLLSLKTFTDKPVTGLYFSSLKDYYIAREHLKINQIKCYEDDFRPEDRYLMERFITANVEYVGQAKQAKLTHQANTVNASQQPNTIVQAKCRPTSVDVNLTMLSLDIECSMQGALYSIGLYSDVIQKVFIIGNEETLNEGHQFIEFVDDEKALLLSLLTFINSYDPDIIIGWNVINFDMALLQKRYDKYGIKFSIGRDNSPPYWRENKGSGQRYIEIAGRVMLDGIDLLKTATYNFPSFSLDNVSNTLLGIGKKVDDVDNRVKEITDNFYHNKQALAAYNLEDCRLVWLIFEKTQLLSFAMLRAQLTGLELNRQGGSVAAFTNLYLPKLHRSGYVAPNVGDGAQDFVSPGGFVMDSIPGLFDNILVLDFKSLYPSIIRTFNIDPMGLIEGLKTPTESIEGYDGAYFSRTKHFLPEIITELWAERDKAKVDKNAALSQAIKIIMNSFYGVLGSTGCRFFDPRLSGSITKRSHDILKTTKAWIEEKGYRVIYGDTDSIFVHAGADKSLTQSKKLGEELQNFINQNWQAEIKSRYRVESKLEIEFETLFTKFFMPTIRGQEVGTKKRYAGLVVNNDKQEIIFKGLESVRTDWTELAKMFQRELYRRVFNDEPVADYVLDMVNKTRAGAFDHLLVYRKRLRQKLEHYVKNVPPHVKAARLADDKHKKNGQALKYQNKGWIEYFITLNGPQTKECLDAPLDYQFYIDRQLEAVANAILPFVGTSFNQITDKQLDLF